MLGVNTDGAIVPCALIPWPASLATSADAFSVARVQSRRNDGLTDAPPDRRLSAYQTLVPDKSSADVTRCAAARTAKPVKARDATRIGTRNYVPTVMIELFVSKSSVVAGASGSAIHSEPSTMNAYSCRPLDIGTETLQAPFAISINDVGSPPH